MNAITDFLLLGSADPWGRKTKSEGRLTDYWYSFKRLASNGTESKKPLLASIGRHRSISMFQTYLWPGKYRCKMGIGTRSISTDGSTVCNWLPDERHEYRGSKLELQVRVLPAEKLFLSSRTRGHPRGGLLVLRDSYLELNLSRAAPN